MSPLAAHEPARSLTWPPTTTHSRHVNHKAEDLTPLSAASPARPAIASFEDEINQNPGNYYLSPSHMYADDWIDDSDDDDDGSEVEWDAGITDFALFDSDRRAAAERQEGLPGRWDALIASQASALQRAEERQRTDDAPPPPPRIEDLPSLTPDGSPSMHDDIDLDAWCPGSLLLPRPPLLRERKARFERFLFVGDEDDEDDDASPISSSSSSANGDILEPDRSVLYARAAARRQALRKLERPGLRSSRTLSGRLHVWRRPGREIYPVREEVSAEREAEVER